MKTRAVRLYGEKDLRLEEFELPTIGEGAFRGCAALPAIDFNSAITSVSAYAFDGCTSVTALDLKGITSIGDRAFAGVNITEIDLDPTITAFGVNVFDGCDKVITATVPGIALDSVIANVKASVATLTVLNGETVSDGARRGCAALKVLDLSTVTGTARDALRDV